MGQVIVLFRAFTTQTQAGKSIRGAQFDKAFYPRPGDLGALIKQVINSQRAEQRRQGSQISGVCFLKSQSILLRALQQLNFIHVRTQVTRPS